ncbi:hypothetical protein ACCP99_03450 [Xanthomonas sp. NCPPB 3443]|uniref:hypothetical protein n=1 Tax=Xanthomonas sp. NCPPB 3443 TaxID=3243407 RepID=UPI003556ABC9
MSGKTYRAKPALKISEWSIEQGGGAYISFEEYIDIPGLEKADIRIEFENKKSFDEVSSLIEQLRDAGFIFVVQK